MVASLSLSLSYSVSFFRTFSCSINNDITDIARSLLVRLMAAWEMENVRAGFGLADFFVKSFILYAIHKYDSVCMCARVRVCKFPPGIAETIKNKAYKNAAWRTTRRTTNPGQMLSADCLPTIVRRSHTHTYTCTDTLGRTHVHLYPHSSLHSKARRPYACASREWNKKGKQQSTVLDCYILLRFF